jgi:hypothetical protein
MQDTATIDALTTKVNELARICAGLSKENAELRSQLSALSTKIAPVADHAIGRGADTAPPDSRDPGWATEGAGTAQFSRRAAVGVALAGAAAGIVGVTAVSERSARTGASHATAQAAAAETGNAELTAAELTAAPTATGSVIAATLSTASPVVAGTNTSTGPGVAGTNTSTGAGVSGSSTGSGPGVSGSNTGKGTGVSGTNSGAGAGISATNSGTGPGVHATSSHGRGGIFAGSAAAQIQLTPGAGSHPRSGQRGDLYADGNGRLWFCKKTGATATWHQIA